MLFDQIVLRGSRELSIVLYEEMRACCQSTLHGREGSRV